MTNAEADEEQGGIDRDASGHRVAGYSLPCRSSVLGAAAFELNGSGTVNRVHVTAGRKEIAQQATDGQFYWLHTDHLGTPRRMTNSTGTVMFRGEYDPHGNPLLEWTTISNGKFTGYERDAAAGLDFAQARHYKFGRGRFMQPDPSGMRFVRPREPESLNRYRYVSNDPVNRVDRNGLEDGWWIVGNFSVTISGGGNGPINGVGYRGYGLDAMFLPEDGQVDGPGLPLFGGYGGGSLQLPIIASLSSSLMGRLGNGFNLLINRLHFPSQKCLDNVIT